VKEFYNGMVKKAIQRKKTLQPNLFNNLNIKEMEEQKVMQWMNSNLKKINKNFLIY
jgi:hypothetical protein